MSKPTDKHWSVARNLLQYLAATKDKRITFRRVTHKEYKLHSFHDSDYAACVDTRRSTTGILDSDRRSHTLNDSKDEWLDEYERNHPLEITSEPESVEDLRPTVESETEDVVNETMDLPSPDEEPANRDATVEDEIGGKQEIENFIEDQSEKIKEENGIQEPMVNRTSYQNFMIRMKESIEDCKPI